VGTSLAFAILLISNAVIEVEGTWASAFYLITAAAILGMNLQANPEMQVKEITYEITSMGHCC